MPPRNVYGKRSRAIYDPLAAFASPQSSSPESANGLREPIATKPKESEKQDRSTPKNDKSVRKRNALGEISANEAVKLVNPLKVASKTKRTHRRKIVVDDSEDERLTRTTNDVNIMRMVQTPKHQVPFPSTGDAEHRRIPIQDGTQDVPLVNDAQDLNSDTDNPRSLTLAREDVHIEEELPAMQFNPNTPSISISPPTPPVLDEYGEHCALLLELSSHQMVDFAEWANELSSCLNITKIAEASFGEVYRLSLVNRSSGFSRNDESVIKVIPLRPPDCKLPTDKRKLNAAIKKTESMSKPVDVATEVRLLQRMSDVPGFTNFRELRVVKGRPPQVFARAFKAFNAAQKARKKELSVFPDPAKKASYADDQLWAVIEMQDAGTDLEILVESGDCSSIWSVWDIFWQVALSLAKGEEEAEFEHRDLHLGNICVRQPTAQDTSSPQINTKRKLHFTGLDTTIIDYTISRAVMPDSSIAYKDLAADNAIFEGDSTEEYQYDMYRYMRSAVFLDNAIIEFPETVPPTAMDRSWEQYHSITNLIWLHFILYKLLEFVAWPSAAKAPSRRDQVSHATWKRANDLEYVLGRVGEILEMSSLFDRNIRSASDFVLHAISEGWLDQEDVVEGRWDYEHVEEALAAQFNALELETKPLDGVDESHDRQEASRSSAGATKKEE
jgi:serine/threonine-protein kinase haspin